MSPGAMKLVRASGKDLLIANIEGNFYAMDNWCTHEQGNLSEGQLKKNVITCPDHESQFDATTGRVLLGPDGESPDTIPAVKSYKIVVQGTDVMVEIP
jgi:3-phenylpropionate/trans-cinnamate dioxygenase ferredoxin subunit